MEFNHEEKVYSETAFRILSAQARVNNLKSPLLVLLPIEGIVPKYVIDGEKLVLSWPEYLNGPAESFGNTRIYFEQMRYFFIGLGISYYVHIKSNPAVGRVCSKEFSKSMTPADFVSADLDPDNLVGVLRGFQVLASYYGGLAVASMSHVCDDYLNLARDSELLKIVVSQIPSKNHFAEPRLVATELFRKDQSLYNTLVSMKERKNLDLLLEKQKRIFQ